MYYFAYGLNLNRQRMAQCCPASRPRFSAELPNYKLVFSGWSRQWHGGSAGIKASRGDKVLGGLYDIAETDMARLDRAEGCPAESRRLNIIVFRDTGESVEAFTYIGSRQAEEAKPSAEYLKIIQQGYREWGLI